VVRASKVLAEAKLATTNSVYYKILCRYFLLSPFPGGCYPGYGKNPGVASKIFPGTILVLLLLWDERLFLIIMW